MSIRDQIADLDPEALLADGFDEAIVGWFQRCGEPTVVVYDYEKCVDVLVARDGISHDEAVEHMEFNVVGAWVGKRTPAFVHRPDPDDARHDPEFDNDVKPKGDA